MKTVAAKPTVLVDYFSARKSWVADCALALLGAAVVGLSAQLSAPMWPVPITAQTLAVLLVGAALGARRGALSITFYLLIGVAGLPWFAGMTGGPASFMKPSFGYIIAFIGSAWVSGRMAERRWDRSFGKTLGAFAAAAVIPYPIGVPYMAMVLAALGKPLSFAEAINLGVTPFLIGDTVKCIIAAAIMPAAWKLLSKLS